MEILNDHRVHGGEVEAIELAFVHVGHPPLASLDGAATHLLVLLILLGAAVLGHRLRRRTG